MPASATRQLVQFLGGAGQRPDMASLPAQKMLDIILYVCYATRRAWLKGNPENAQFINRALALKRLKSKKFHLRAALARQLGLSKITISQIVADQED
jgi:hypothetical protein